jgi:hypothetical protein
MGLDSGEKSFDKRCKTTLQIGLRESMSELGRAVALNAMFRQCLPVAKITYPRRCGG